MSKQRIPGPNLNQYDLAVELAVYEASRVSFVEAQDIVEAVIKAKWLKAASKAPQWVAEQHMNLMGELEAEEKTV